jgi:hypothetical protein
MTDELEIIWKRSWPTLSLPGGTPVRCLTEGTEENYGKYQSLRPVRWPICEISPPAYKHRVAREDQPVRYQAMKTCGLVQI